MLCTGGATSPSSRVMYAVGVMVMHAIITGGATSPSSNTALVRCGWKRHLNRSEVCFSERGVHFSAAEVYHVILDVPHALLSPH